MKNFVIKTIVVFLLLLITKGILSKPAIAAPKQINANITIQGVGSPISKNIWGVDFQPMVDLSANSPPFDFFQYMSQAQLAQLGISIVRFPGGCAADYYDVSTGQLSYNSGGVPVTKQFFTLDQVLNFTNAIGSDILFQVNIDGNTVGTPDVVNLPNSCGATSLLTNTTANPAAKDFDNGLLNDLQTMVTTAQYNTIVNFEIGNEQWLNWTPQWYADRAIKAAHVIKANDTGGIMRVGVIGYPTLAPISAAKTAWNQMIQTILLNNNDCGPSNNLPCFDFVTDHNYPRAKVVTTPFNGQAAYYPVTNMGNQFTVNVANFPSKAFGLSEWNLPCMVNPPNSPVSMVNTADHGIFAFTTLMTMAQNNIALGIYHDLSINGNPIGAPYGCGLFSDPTTYSATGQAFSFSAQAAGGETVTTQITFPQNDGFICLPNNASCTDADCLVGSAANCATTNNLAYSTLSAYAVKQGTDLFVYLVNRNDASVANPVTIQAQVIATVWPGYQSQMTVDQLSATAFNAPFFNQINLANNTPQTTGQFLLPLPPTSITRIQLSGHFNGAPTPTPTSFVHPTNSWKIIQNIINSKRPETPCKVTLEGIAMYVYAVVMYIMVIHFAIAMKKEFKINLFVTCFVIGGGIGIHLCHLEYGFIIGMILSLVLW